MWWVLAPCVFAALLFVHGLATDIRLRWRRRRLTADERRNWNPVDGRARRRLDTGIFRWSKRVALDDARAEWFVHIDRLTNDSSERRRHDADYPGGCTDRW